MEFLCLCYIQFTIVPWILLSLFVAVFLKKSRSFYNIIDVAVYAMKMTLFFLNIAVTRPNF